MNPGNCELAVHRKFHEAIDYLDMLGVKPLTRKELDLVSDKYKKEFLKGIRHPGTGSLAMIDTELPPFDPTKVDPSHKVLVLEVGGTNTRAAIVNADTGGNVQIQNSDDLSPCFRQASISKKTYSNPWDFVRAMMDPVKDILDGQTFDGLGIVYSFLGKTCHTPNGVDVISDKNMAKGFSVEGIENVHIGQTFLEILRENLAKWNITNLPDYLKIAVMNDTVAVLQGKWGGVVGTGFNFALSHNGKIHNSESGGFDGLPPTVLSQIIDIESDNPYLQLAEKQISGMYMGNSITTIGKELALSSIISDEIRRKFLSSPDMSVHLGKNPNRQTLYARHVLPEEYGAMLAASARLRYRSAQCVGTMIGSAVSLDPGDPFDEIRIPIEGSLFWGTPGYETIARTEAIRYSGRPIRFLQIPNAGILGAAGHVFNLLYENS